MRYGGTYEDMVEHPLNWRKHSESYRQKLKGLVRIGKMSRQRYREITEKGVYEPIVNSNPTPYADYLKIVRAMTFSKLNKTNWYKGPKEGFEMDHIVPVVYMYALGIRHTIASDPINVRYMEASANREKYSLITLDSLETWRHLACKYPELNKHSEPPVGWLIVTDLNPKTIPHSKVMRKKKRKRKRTIKDNQTQTKWKHQLESGTR